MRPAMQRVRGFTLIELVIVTIVIGIMAAVLAPLMLSSLRAYDDTLGDVVALDKLRYATERLAREIREVNDTDASANTNFAINMSTTAPVFTRTYRSCDNADCSAATDTTATITVGYPVAVSGFNGNCVTLTDSSTAAGARVLVDEVGSLAFAYFDKNGCNNLSPISATCPFPIPVTSQNVRYVQISLTLNHVVEGVTQTYTQTTRVGLRNR